MCLGKHFVLLKIRDICLHFYHLGFYMSVCYVLFIVCSVLFFCFYLVYVLITLTDCIVPYVKV